MLQIIIIGGLAFFIFSMIADMFGADIETSSIAGIVAAIVCVILYLIILENHYNKCEEEKNKNKKKNEEYLSSKMLTSNCKKIEFWDLTIYSSNNEYSFNYCGSSPQTRIKRKGEWKYEVKIKTGFNQNIDLKNAFSLAAASMISGCGVILNGTDDNCITQIILTMTNGTYSDSICACNYILSFEDENLVEVKRFLSFVEELNNNLF